jgi:hypothetical protein
MCEILFTVKRQTRINSSFHFQMLSIYSVQKLSMDCKALHFRTTPTALCSFIHLHQQLPFFHPHLQRVPRLCVDDFRPFNVFVEYNVLVDCEFCLVQQKKARSTRSDCRAVCCWILFLARIDLVRSHARGMDKVSIQNSVAVAVAT